MNLTNILLELEYRVGEIVNLKKQSQRSVLIEILHEWGYGDIASEWVNNLVEGPNDGDKKRTPSEMAADKSKEDKYKHVGMGIYVKDGDYIPGKEDGEGSAKEGAKKFKKDGDTFKPISDKEANDIKNDIGDEGGSKNNPEADSKDGETNVDGEQKPEPETGTALKGKGAEGYLKQIKGEEDAATESDNDNTKPITKKKSSTIPTVKNDDNSTTMKTSSGKTLYSVGGGYYSDSPSGSPKYIRVENTDISVVEGKVHGKTTTGKDVVVKDIPVDKLAKADKEYKKSQFPKFAEQSSDEIANYLVGTSSKTATYKPITTKDMFVELDDSRNDAYNGKNAGKGGPDTTAQEEVSCRIIELAYENPKLSPTEIVNMMIDEMAKIPYYKKKNRKQLEKLAIASSAGIGIMNWVKTKENSDFNPTQPKGFPKSYAFSGKASETTSNLLISKLEEAKKSGDTDGIEHYSNEIRKFAEHSTSATGSEGDGDTALMYEDVNGRIKILHITNKQSYNDPKSNTTKRARANDIKNNAVEGTDIDSLVNINQIASGEVRGMNEIATTSMAALSNPTSQRDIDNIPPNIITSVYGRGAGDTTDKYVKNAIKNKIVVGELRSIIKKRDNLTSDEIDNMSDDEVRNSVNEKEIIQAITTSVGRKGAHNIADSGPGSPGKFLMKMGNLWGDVNSKFEIERRKHPKKTDDEICEIISKKVDPKTKKPLYGGGLSSEDILSIKNNKYLQDLSSINDTRGESMKHTHEDIVKNVTESDIKYFMDKGGISEYQARERVKTENGPHTETVIRTFMKSVHWTRSITGTADDEIVSSVGSDYVQPQHYRECLSSLTGFDGDISTRAGRENLLNHLAKSVKITPGEGSVQFINSKTGKTVLLGEDTWRTAGDGEKIAGHDGSDLIKCLKSKRKK